MSYLATYQPSHWPRDLHFPRSLFPVQRREWEMWLLYRQTDYYEAPVQLRIIDFWLDLPFFALVEYMYSCLCHRYVCGLQKNLLAVEPVSKFTTWVIGNRKMIGACSFSYVCRRHFCIARIIALIFLFFFLFLFTDGGLNTNRPGA